MTDSVIPFRIYWDEYMWKGMIFLNSYGMAEDTLRCDAVWQRILPNMDPYPEVRKEAAKRAEASCGKKIGENDILRYIEDELQDRCCYMALSRKARTKAEMRCLAAIGAAEAGHAKKLEAVYFIMTGKHPCVSSPELPKICCFTDTLRQRYHEEKKAHQEYLQAAQKAEDERAKKLFECLAEEEAAHADIIWSLFV